MFKDRSEFYYIHVLRMALKHISSHRYWICHALFVFKVFTCLWYLGINFYKTLQFLCLYFIYFNYLYYHMFQWFSYFALVLWSWRKYTSIISHQRKNKLNQLRTNINVKWINFNSHEHLLNKVLPFFLYLHLYWGEKSTKFTR